MKRSDLLPDREFYLSGTHPGTDIWRHARTPLTPQWPRWIHENSPCQHLFTPGGAPEGTEPLPCRGRRVPYKTSLTDAGVCTITDYVETGTSPTPDAHAGDWICELCFAQGVISLAEVQQGPDDVPPARNDDNVVPLFGPREVTCG